MSAPLVSCIVPYFDGARFVEEAIRSILAQTHRPIEIIVVDDGSADPVAPLLAPFGGMVRCYRQPNGGPAAACNTGIQLSGGAYVAFLEQDDTWVPRKLELQVGALEAAPDAEYCVTHIQNVWSGGMETQARQYFGHPAMRPVPGYVVQTLVARRGVFEQVGVFDRDLRFAMATEWFIRARERGIQEILLPDVLTHRRLHDRNYSRINRADSREQFLHVVKDMLVRRRTAGNLPDPAED